MRVSGVLVLLLGFSVLCAECWFEIPHMIVGQIGYLSLSEKNARKIDAILALLKNAYPHETQTLGTFAVWPDVLKEKGIHTMDGWHFINKVYNDPDDPMANPVANESSENIVFSLGSLLKTFNTSTDGFARAFSLGYVSHLIGDILEPMHCIAKFSNAQPRGDLGGNLTPIKLAISSNTSVGSFCASMPMPIVTPSIYNYRYMTNLHSFWDNGAFVFDPPAAAAQQPYSADGIAYVLEQSNKLIACLDPQNSRYTATSNFSEIADQSYVTARESYIRFRSASGQYVIDDDNLAWTRKQVAEAIVRAGRTLGALLESILSRDPDVAPPVASPTAAASRSPSAVSGPSGSPTSAAPKKHHGSTGMIVGAFVVSALVVGSILAAALYLTRRKRPSASSSHSSSSSSGAGLGGARGTELSVVASNPRSPQIKGMRGPSLLDNDHPMV